MERPLSRQLLRIRTLQGFQMMTTGHVKSQAMQCLSYQSVSVIAAKPFSNIYQLGFCVTSFNELFKESYSLLY